MLTQNHAIGSEESKTGMETWNQNHFSALPAIAANSREQRKWKGGLLQIFQIEEGFSFIYYICDNGHPARAEKGQGERLVGYRYNIEKNKNGEGFIESRAFICREYNADNLHHSMSLADRMIDVLRELLQSYHVSRMKLEMIVLDLEAIVNLGSLLADHGINSIDMHCVTFDCITDSHRTKFVDLIRASGARFLDMKGREQPLTQGLLNEEFITDVAQTQLERFHSNAVPGAVYPHLFMPSMTIFIALSRLQSFDAPSMVLKCEWVIELLMNFMDNLDPSLPFLDFTWRFAIDAPLSEQIMTEKIREQQYDFRIRNNLCYLFKKETSALAKFSSIGYLVDEGRARMSIVTVHFIIPHWARD